ncbi:hypothetical protein AB0G15_32835 [Streptosporangium sp. NPDC023825]|uniref:hypothetical protein n=1 Tax=Streptosporangium sp. NPDC023825 TaxID=3154909 RepID=UPI0034496A42
MPVPDDLAALRQTTWTSLRQAGPVPSWKGRNHEGTARGRHLEQRREQAWCLTLVTNVVM